MFEDVYILVLKDEEQKRFFMRKSVKRSSGYFCQLRAVYSEVSWS